MKLVMTLVCRDEADIIRQNIDTHLRLGVDHVLVTDHGSRDGTRDILAEYERLGVATVFDETRPELAQSKWMTRMADLARTRHGANWVLNNDADEFWIPESGNLKDALQNTCAQILQARRINMLYPYDTRSEAPWQERLVYRVAQQVPMPALRNFYDASLAFPYFYHDLPPKVLTHTQGLSSVHTGNHGASYRVSVTTELSSINIFHFPVRNLEQFTRKVLNGTEAILLNPHIRPRQSWHQRRWYRLAQQKGVVAAIADALPDSERLTQDLKDGIVVEDRTIHDFLDWRLAG